MIQTSSIIAMAVTGVICTLYPIILLVLWRKKTGAALAPFFVGAGTFFLFALILEQLLHQVCMLGDNAVARTISTSVALSTLYGGLTAGVFEETGRFVAFKLMKKHDSKETAITYGIGHGGIEAILIVGIGMLANAGLSLFLNQTGTTNLGVIGGPDGPTSVFLGDAGGALLSTLQGITPVSCALATYERIVTVLFHIALSVLVFAAARRPGKLWLYPAAVVIHACVDFIAVLYQLGIVKSLLLTELFITVYTALTIVFALWVWKKLTAPPEPEEALE